MAIIVRTAGGPAARVERTPYAREDDVQRFVAENPDAIPLDELGEGKSLLVVAREFPTESGPIDALGLDAGGDLYVVETKLARNPDKRTVLAQALDYGASLWAHAGDTAGFAADLDRACRKLHGASLAEKLAERFGLDADAAEAALGRARACLAEGAFRVVVLMDEVEDRLRDLVSFVNQNSKFDVYAVELECYRHGEQEIVIPRLFGAVARKSLAPVAPAGERRAWTVEEVLADADRLAPESARAFRRICDAAAAMGAELRPGTGAYGSLNVTFPAVGPKSLFTVGANGRLALNLEWTPPAARDALLAAARGLGWPLPDDAASKRPSVREESWVPRADAFLDAVRNIVADAA